MPLIPATGNLLDSKAKGLVNPVNCIGVAGAGLALQFRNRWPVQVAEYTAFCKAGKMRPGVIHDALLPDGRRILSVPTKQHWRDTSRLEVIGLGLAGLKAYLKATGMKSVALPPLGCGLGGLPKSQVAMLIWAWLDDSPAAIHLYGFDEINWSRYARRDDQGHGGTGVPREPGPVPGGVDPGREG
jgi:O-acetyl-ADP-ribose deacetylase (regulator of RNase III)